MGWATVSALGALCVGAVLLMWGAELLMENVATVARRLGLPVVAVGLLLVGAEPEELATGVIAARGGHPVLAATDALGANLTMATLGLGLALVVSPVALSAALGRYVVLAVAAGLAAWGAIFDGSVSRAEAWALVIGFVVAVAVVWILDRRPPTIGELAEDHADEAGRSDDPDEDEGRSGWSAGLRMLIGLAVIALGGTRVVSGAVALAESAGLSEQQVGLSALAFATSAEVLALVASARRRSLESVAVAGVVGAMLYNATLTLGTAALVAPMTVPDLRPVAALAAALPVSLLLARGGRRSRVVGLVLVLTYGGYLAAVLAGW